MVNILVTSLVRLFEKTLKSMLPTVTVTVGSMFFLDFADPPNYDCSDTKL